MINDIQKYTSNGINFGLLAFLLQGEADHPCAMNGNRTKFDRGPKPYNTSSTTNSRK